jgi:hypothetical protein
MAEAPTSTTVYQQALPEYAAPYFERMLQRAETESLQKYQPYTGARLADFTGAERAAQQGITSLERPGQIAAATGVAAGLAAPPGAGEKSAFQYATEYTPGAFSAGYSPTDVSSQYAPGQVANQYQAGTYAPQYQAGTAASGYTAGTFTPGYQAGQLGIASQFSPQAAAAYMTPYQEQVTSAAVREVEKGAERARTGISQAAAQAGGRGGYREALERAELQRNVLEQTGDITAKGRAASYEQAMQQFERDRQAQMQGYQLQESARQQQAQLGMSAQQASEQARQRAAELGLTAQQQNEAARQAGEQFRLQGFQAQEAARQSQGQMGLQAFQANEAARQAAGQMGLSAQEITGRQRLSSAELAARQEAARESARQQATQFGLAGLQQDLAAKQQRLAAAQTLGNLGQTQQAMDIERLGQQESVGQRQRSMNQASLDVGYQDFLNQLGYTQGQLGFFSNILRGVPVQPQQTVSTFQQQPSLFQSVLGTGLSGLGLYNALRGGR